MDHIPTSVEKRSTNTSGNNNTLFPFYVVRSKFNTMNQLMVKQDNNQAQTHTAKTFHTQIYQNHLKSDICGKSLIWGNIREHHKLAPSHSTN